MVRVPGEARSVTAAQFSPLKSQKPATTSTRFAPFTDAFYCVSIRLGWEYALLQLRKPYQWLGRLLWYKASLRKSLSFTLSNIDVAPFGIEPDAKVRALKELVAAGLIEVDWGHKKRSPLVTILPEAGPRMKDGFEEE
jgi:hypothetical protein